MIFPSENTARGDGALQQILLVDDDPLFLASVRRGLRRYAIVTESDPLRGLKLLSTQPFAFVVSDFNFDPGALDGVEFLTRVRRQVPGVGRVLASASVVPGLDGHLATGVVEHFVSKPVAPHQLERWLDAWATDRA
jgi:CheY-like chemotaxis protein